MLIEFSTSNFRSIKELQTLSFVAAPIVSKVKELDESNTVLTNESMRLLKTIGIYGANGSGKSNIIKAIASMMIIIRDSFANQETIKEYAQPFILDIKSKSLPTFFQIIFKEKENQYRYGFEVKAEKVVSEWLFGPAQVNEVFYFEREGGNIKINKNSFPEGVGLENRTKDSNLFLNVVHAFDGKISYSIKEYFGKKIAISLGNNDERVKTGMLEYLQNKANYSRIIELLQNADFGIKNIKRIPLEGEDNSNKDINPKRKKIDNIVAERSVYNSKGKEVRTIEVPFEQFESEGTKKLFYHAGLLLNALQVGRTIFIDEFDARLHPLLTKYIIKLFNSKEHNPQNAQLIFVTNDTSLLDSSFLRRDQIYFVEKNKVGASHYYSLINIGGVRNDASYGKDYIKGKYGAVPFLRTPDLD